MWGAIAGAAVSAFSASQNKGGDVKQVDTLTREERKAKDAAFKWLQDYIGQGAEAYGGDLVADIPGLFTQAYDEYAGQFGNEYSQQAIRDQISAKPGYEYNPEQITNQWKNTYAGPIMEAYRETVLPSALEGFNVPGGLYSNATSKGTMREMGNFYAGQVAPTLFNAQQQGQQMGYQSKEAALARQPGALGLPAKQFGEYATAANIMKSFEQEELTAAYQEFIRTQAEPGWAFNAAAGVQGSLDAYAQQPYDPYAGIMSGALAGMKIEDMYFS